VVNGPPSPEWGWGRESPFWARRGDGGSGYGRKGERAIWVRREDFEFRATLPVFCWLKISGGAGIDDLGLSEGHQLRGSVATIGIPIATTGRRRALHRAGGEAVEILIPVTLPSLGRLRARRCLPLLAGPIRPAEHARGARRIAQRNTNGLLTVVARRARRVTARGLGCFWRERQLIGSAADLLGVVAGCSGAAIVPTLVAGRGPRPAAVVRLIV
jgi:hypothetical protein